MKKYKIVYCTPSLYISGGIERVLTTKANYLADVLGYDIYIILTDGKDKEPFYELSNKVHVINLDINFERLWSLSFFEKIPVYLYKQRLYKKKLSHTLYKIKPDITISLLRREINFINNIKDGSKKIGELHVSRNNYRNFENNENNYLKTLFSKLWMKALVRKLKRLDYLIVLTEEDKKNWHEINKIAAIPNPIQGLNHEFSNLQKKNVIAVGRYVYSKGFDLLLRSWKIVNQKHPDWTLQIFGTGDRKKYIEFSKELHIQKSCIINAEVPDIGKKYLESSIAVVSSRFEGFGMVIIESMSYGIPTVSFSCPYGPRNIITNNQNGLLIENGNIESLANGICRLIEDKKLRKKLSDQCIKDYPLYNIENIAKKWIKLFEEITQ